MSIEKLEEFAKDGDKNLDNLDVSQGFLQSEKPERQWFNDLFNRITKKTNEVIDYTDGVVDDVAAQKLDTGITVTAKNDGVERPLSERLSDSIYIGDLHDGGADWTAAFNKAAALSGRRVVVPNLGFEYIVNGTLEVYCDFYGIGKPVVRIFVSGNNGAIAGDRGFWPQSNSSLSNIHIKREVLRTYEGHTGDFAAGLTLGKFVDAEGMESTNITLNNITLEGVNDNGDAYLRTLILSIVGNTSHVTFNNLSIIGLASIAAQLHWSGDIDAADPHGSPITKTYHPRHITFNDMYINLSNSNAYGTLGMFFSACHDIEINNLVIEDTQEGVKFYVGDEGDTFADTPSVNRCLKNIVINGMSCDNLVARAVIADGKAFSRSAVPYLAINNKPSITINDLSINKGALATSAHTDIYTNKFRGLTVNNVDITESVLCPSVLPSVNITASADIEINGSIAARFPWNVTSSKNVTIDTVDVCTLPSNSITNKGGRLTSVAATTTLTAVPASGATQVTFTQLPLDALEGGYIEYAGRKYNIKKAVSNGTENAVVDLRTAIVSPSGTSVVLYAPCVDTQILGSAESFHTGFLLENTNGAKPINTTISKSYIDSYSRDVTLDNADGVEFVKSSFDRCAQRTTTAGINVEVLSTATVDGLVFDRCGFEKVTGSNVNVANCISLSATTDAPVLSKNRFYGSKADAVKMSTPSGGSAVQPPMFDNNWYGINVTNPVTSSSLQYASIGMGRQKLAFGYSAPSYGVWRTGDVVFNIDQSAAPNTIGWVCTASGTSGTWKSFGTASA